MVNLGTLPGTFIPASYAYGINDHDLIVGASYREGFLITHATLWIDDAPVDLNDLIEPTSQWELVEAQKINNAGQIVGYGIKDDQDRAFLLTPRGAVPAVSQWGLIVMALIVITTVTVLLARRRAAG